MVAAWLAEGLGCAVPEICYEKRSQDQHPLLPQPVLRPAHGAPPGAEEGQRALGIFIARSGMAECDRDAQACGHLVYQAAAWPSAGR